MVSLVNSTKHLKNITNSPQKHFHTHYMRPTLSYYQNQIKTLWENKRPISLINIEAKIFRYWQLKSDNVKDNYKPQPSGIYSRYGRLGQHFENSINIIQHINRTKKKNTWSLYQLIKKKQKLLTKSYSHSW